MPRTAPVVQFSLVGRWTNGRAVTNVLHYLYGASAPIVADTTAQASRVISQWQQHLMDVLTDNYTIDSCRFTDLTTVNSPTGEVPFDPAQPRSGLNTAGALPPNVAPLVTKQVFLSGRDRRDGRLFLPAIHEAAVGENGEIVSANFTAMQNGLNDFFNGTTGQIGGVGPDWQHATVHYDSVPFTPDPLPRRVPDDALGEIRQVDSFVLQPTVSTQRRRLRG